MTERLTSDEIRDLPVSDPPTLADSLSKLARHMAILNDETGELRDEMIETRTDVGWLKKFLWVLLAGVVSVLGGVGLLLLKEFLDLLKGGTP